ncbi:protein phosphatase 2C domain-containing protein [Streptomyces sp. OM5714]|uniref:protein phosphatase 2C domain-containing protein n=1 Tax=Streptomyces sp. OM5714 TaxID=2602736 RepID=UPI0013DC6636|nr:protein phosphatase 2C domain-containing protein [Streptomyces sp. OM5714]
MRPGGPERGPYGEDSGTYGRQTGSPGGASGAYSGGPGPGSEGSGSHGGGAGSYGRDPGSYGGDLGLRGRAPGPHPAERPGPGAAGVPGQGPGPLSVPYAVDGPGPGGAPRSGAEGTVHGAPPRDALRGADAVPPGGSGNSGGPGNSGGLGGPGGPGESRTSSVGLPVTPGAGGEASDTGRGRPYAGGSGGDAGPDGEAGPRHAAPRASGQERYAPAPGARRWERVVLGTPAAHVEPKPPPADPYRPDTIFDGWSSPGLTVRLASVRGDQHRFGGPPRQDDVVVAWHEPTDRVVFAVADGVSSAPHSHIGAALACRTAVNDVLAQLAQERSEPDWTRVLQAAAYQLVMRVAGGREPGERDRAEAARQLATTLVTGTVAARGDGRMDVTVVRAGDSSAWCLHGGGYHALLHDGSAEDGDISSTAVVALPRLLPRTRPITYTLPADSVVLVGTDGFGVPLGDGSGPVGEIFAGALQDGPPEPRMLAHLLDFSRETFDDDRTLLAVWSRRAPRGGPR